MPRAENVLQLIEWIRFGRVFYIHRDLLQYIDIDSIISLSIVSNHYRQKYLVYCLQHYFASNVNLLYDIKQMYVVKKWYGGKANIYQILSIVTYADVNYQYNINKLKQLYARNKKIRIMLNKYFRISSS